VRNTSWSGLIDLQRQFIGQHNMDGLIVDERWNGGGMLPWRFIELLNRPVLNYWARRDGISWRSPYRTHLGPQVMLINHAAGSGGDAFPYYYREAGLGKLIGTRTWGGLVGLTGNPGLIDGGYCSVPTFAIYELDGTWTIEGHGVEPDIEVIDHPTLLAKGIDPQLEKAIDVVLEELKTNTWRDVPRPPYPDRSGAGIPVEER
jgi:tricorn protease